MDNLSVEMRINGKRTYVELKGRFTLMDALSLKDSLAASIGDRECLVVDLREVSEIDLTGLNALLMTQIRLRKKASSLLVLAQTEHPIHELLRLTKFQDQIEVKKRDLVSNTIDTPLQKAG